MTKDDRKVDLNNKELHQVRKIESDIRNRERLHKIRQKGSDVAQMPSQLLRQEIDNNDDKGLEGQREVERFIRPATNVMGDMVDASRREEILKRAEYARKQAVAGDRFYQMSKNGDFDFSNVTKGDLAAYQAIKKNPKISDAEIYQIRNADTDRVRGINQKERKQLFELKKTVAINQYEEQLREYANVHPEKFTPKQLEVINSENGMFNYSVKGQVHMNQEINQIYMRNMAEAGSFKDMKFGMMKAADMEAFVFRKDALRAQIKQINVFRPVSNKFEVACYASYEFKAVNEALVKVGVGGKRSRGLVRGGFEYVLGNAYHNSELGQNVRMINRAVKTGETAVKVGVKGTELAYRTVRYTGGKAGAGITAELDAAGNKAMADKLRQFGQNYVDTEKSISKGVETAKKAPSRLVNKQVEKIKQSKTAKEIKRMRDEMAKTKIGQAMGKFKKGAKEAGHAAMAPMRAMGKVVDFVKKNILIPVAIAIGVIFLLLILVSSLSGLGGGVSSVSFLILDSEEHLKDFQIAYDTHDTQFITQVDSIINGYAQTTNKKGTRIRYGINGAYNAEGNENDDYKNGVTLNYFVDGAPSAGISSNLEDCLSVMAVLTQQQLEKFHDEALELLEALYKSSHTYNYTESALYSCPSSCETTHYYCNQKNASEGDTGTAYWGTDMKYSPWLYEELFKPTAEQECVVCRAEGGDMVIDGELNSAKYVDYAGCTVTGTCYHGDGGNMGKSTGSCDNHKSVYSCPGHDSASFDEQGNEVITTDYCTSELGCKGYYECLGHDHYGCPDGHDTKTCFGHVDIVMNVNIASIDRLLEMGGVEVKGEAAYKPTENDDVNADLGDGESDDE